MHSTFKYLSIGLIIGLLGSSILIATGLLISKSSFLPPPKMDPEASIPASSSSSGMPVQKPEQGFTSSPIPTLTVARTATPDPGFPTTATPDAVQETINNGGLIFTGSLSNEQQIALYKASLLYVEPTVLESIKKAKEVNGVGYGDPSNICGPLAIAIIQNAGISNNTGLVPHDFWLLNPLASGDQKLLEREFPSDRYLHTRFTTSLNRINWRIFPLQPGDFLFIWHGSGGNFDHMLVVTRVDSNLRAYTVTNYATPGGFVIAETLLYDPGDPEVGIFHTWTHEKDAILGSTGFGGFELWRPIYP